MPNDNDVDNDKDAPITKTIMIAYMSVIEKHTEQMSSVVINLEQISEKLGALEAHFNNGFKAAIIDNSEHSAEKILSQIDKVAATASALAAANEKASVALSALNEKNSVALASLNDKNTTATMTLLDKSMGDIKSALKVNTITNIIGWGGLVVTIILKLFGKM